MHLSLLSDRRTSDAISDAGHAQTYASYARAHRDGLIRGLVFVAAIAVPLCLALATGQNIHQHPSDGYAQVFADDR